MPNSCLTASAWGPNHALCAHMNAHTEFRLTVDVLRNHALSVALKCDHWMLSETGGTHACAAPSPPFDTRGCSSVHACIWGIAPNCAENGRMSCIHTLRGPLDGTHVEAAHQRN